ncbi:MAG TPA: N-acetylmuramic acid 6-phosphate etherase, partial [Bacteroidetes bacterium]|nr:N-acetylmuramic acid 6-phosphate etherase [Bacteroidota bacterium]
ERSKRTLIIVTGVDYEAAARYLEAAEGHVKTAIVMIKAGVSKEEARKRLQMTEGNVRRAIEVNPL